jgi:putative transposase
MVQDLKDLIMEKQSKGQYNILRIDITSNYVDLLIQVNPLITINSTIGRIKGGFSCVLRGKYPDLKARMPALWARKNLISATCDISPEAIKGYLDRQKEI